MTEDDRGADGGEGGSGRDEDSSLGSSRGGSEITPGGDGGEPEVGAVPPEVRELVDQLSHAQLQGLSRYVATELESTDTGSPGAASTGDGPTGDRPANDGATSDRSAEGESGMESEGVDDTPEGVPSKATRVVKEINDNRYYYWQWRDGDSVESKYDRPVDAG